MTKYLFNVQQLLNILLNLNDDILDEIVGEYNDIISEYFKVKLSILKKNEKINLIIKYIIDDNNISYHKLSDAEQLFIEELAKQLIQYDEVINYDLNLLKEDNTLPKNVTDNILKFLYHLQIKTIEDYIKNRLDHDYHLHRKTILLNLFSKYNKILNQINKLILNTM